MQLFTIGFLLGLYTSRKITQMVSETSQRWLMEHVAPHLHMVIKYHYIWMAPLVAFQWTCSALLDNKVSEKNILVSPIMSAATAAATEEALESPPSEKLEADKTARDVLKRWYRKTTHLLGWMAPVLILGKIGLWSLPMARPLIANENVNFNVRNHFLFAGTLIALQNLISRRSEWTTGLHEHRFFIDSLLFLQAIANLGSQYYLSFYNYVTLGSPPPPIIPKFS